MRPIDIEFLNKKSPYAITCDGADGYSFATGFGVEYIIYFMPDYSIWNEGAYQFVIANRNQRKSPNDPKVKEAVLAIIEGFFDSNQAILLYVCETGDGKEALRNRLFLRWMSEYDNRSIYYLEHVELQVERIDNYATLIVQKTNPRLNEIIEEFQRAIDEIRKPNDHFKRQQI